jgi:RNA polymerase sigma-70 factor (ECF subfamily)
MPAGIWHAARVEKHQFAELVERHRGELRVHCYRMLGSLDESEDLVQETFLRAWKNLDGFEGRSSFRAWLYRIATNACLDALDGRTRRVLPHDLSPSSQPRPGLPVAADVAWLQPFPDRLWEPGPDEEVVARETIELAFLAAIQHLPPRQRAVLILRDVLGFPAKQIASQIDGSVASVNSALQRARATLREHLPERRLDWAPTTEPTADELAVLRRYMTAVERADLSAMAEMLAEDVRATMPPFPHWFQGRDAVLGSLAASWDPALPGYVGRFDLVETRANRQPAAGAYIDGKPFAIGVLRVVDGRIAEMTAFHEPHLFAAFGLPMTFPVADRHKSQRMT